MGNARRLLRRRFRLALPAACALLIAVTWLVFSAPRPEPYATFVRPDGAYSVVVMRQPQWWAMFPGQSGDAPGVVHLYDRQGRLLEEAPVEMVQLADRVDWSGGAVRIPWIAEWVVPAALE